MEEVTKNPRAEITYKKYQKQIDWRRNKVRELLIRGYSQYEISSTLHISQPTISRDIDFIRNQTNSAAKQDLAHRMSCEQQKGLEGLEELMKNLWLIIDNPKIEVKEKISAMKLMLQYQYMRLKLVDCQAFIKQFYDYADKVERDEEANTIREQEVSRREIRLEKVLEYHLKNERLTRNEINQIIYPNQVF